MHALIQDFVRAIWVLVLGQWNPNILNIVFHDIFEYLVRVALASCVAVVLYECLAVRTLLFWRVTKE